mgnify:CR=1 FL=1
MRYVLEIPPELAEEINRQIRSGKYRSPQDFIIAAIQNQIQLESQETLETASELPISPEYSALSSSQSAAPIMKTVAVQLLSSDVAKVKTVSLKNLERPSALWGQYNRFFPVKIVTRVAANLAKEYSSDYVPLGELQERSAQIAREFGKIIERKDKQLGRKRGTIISAGLPIGRDQDKAKSRFKNQFVGNMVGNRIEGASPTLKFLDMMKDEKNSVLVGITDFGLRFASLSNPVIDLEDYSAALSAEEVEFLLDHIASEVLGEAKLIRLILAGVKEGIATPEELNNRFKVYYSDWKRNEVVMMRAGVVSRIGELGLLERRKDGVRVTYLLTDLGEKYLDRLSKLEA